MECPALAITHTVLPLYGNRHLLIGEWRTGLCRFPKREDTCRMGKIRYKQPKQQSRSLSEFRVCHNLCRLENINGVSKPSKGSGLESSAT